MANPIPPPENINYAATIVSVNVINDLPGLDNLVGVPVLGHQALTTKGVKHSDLRVAFTAETQLSNEYAKQNNLYRDLTLNVDPTETGYLEKNARIRALKMRGHRSDALLMPIDSLRYTGIDPALLVEGATFDTLNGHPICQKYVVTLANGATKTPQQKALDKAFKRVTKGMFPEHLDTSQYGRCKHLLRTGREVILTQKLHGTSIRVGNVPVLREHTWKERLAKRFGIAVADHEFDVIYGSRKVIKDANNPRQNHFYDSDIWTKYGQKIAEQIPPGYIVYGELIGWTPDGAEIQKNYTYDVPKGQAEMYVYRVAFINLRGDISDLPWDGVKDFCAARGLRWTPELFRFTHEGSTLDDYLAAAEDAQFYVDWSDSDTGTFRDIPLPLSSHKTVDEGICIRQESTVPTILKAKSAKFLAHETKLLDNDYVDLESAA